jgi:hypothetical protein
MLPPTMPERADQPVAGELTFIEPARPPLIPGRASEHLVEQLLRVDADGERVARARVGRGNAVALLETLATPGRDASCPE